jgi:transcription elongation factor GreA
MSTNKSNPSISPEGKAEAEEELRHLREVRGPEIVDAIKTAREHGDLSENAEYHAAREQQGLNEARARSLEHQLATAEVRESSAGGKVDVGSKVSFDDGRGRKEVTIVHRLEASLAEGKLSSESPVGKSLLGARQGERVNFETPRGEKQLEVIEVV